MRASVVIALIGLACSIFQTTAQAGSCPDLFSAKIDSKAGVAMADKATSIDLALPLTPQIADYTCGTACLRTVLKFTGGLEISEADLAQLMRTSPRHGSTPDQVTSAAQKLGFFVHAGENLSLADLERSLRAGRPIISLIQSETPGYGHWVVVIGMTETHLKLMDPGTPAENGQYRFISKEKFVKDWWHRFSGRKFHRGVGIELQTARVKETHGLGGGDQDAGL